jgi:hypothetical protein
VRIRVLAPHYSFTAAEFDFIINYNIKDHMERGRESKKEKIDE